MNELKAPRRHRIRRVFVGLLVALSCLLVMLSTTVVWAHRTVLNTDTFVGTVGPVFGHPEVDSAVATRATDQLFTALHLQERLHDALPSKVGFAAAPIVSATEGYVAGQLERVLASPRFQTVWTKTLTTTHENVVALLRGQHSTTLSTSNGYIVLNTVPVINQALSSVGGLASSLTGRHVTLPTITSAELPQQAVDRLSKALGVTLPRNFGQVTLIRSNDLNTAQRGVKAFDRLAWALPVITLLLIGIALWLSFNRRRTLVQLLVGTSLLMILLRGVVRHEQATLANGANNPQVAQTVLTDLLHGFFILTAWILWIAVGLLVIALLTGPYRWAVAMRRAVRSTWQRGMAAVSGDRREVAIAWLGVHADGLQLIGAVVAAIVLLIVGVSWTSVLVIGVLLLVYELLLQAAKRNVEPPERSGSDEHLTTPAADHADRS